MPPSTSNDRSQQFLRFVQQQALAMRAKDQPPKSLPEWEQDRSRLRRQLIRSWGGFPREKCDLQPRVVGALERPDYRVEKLLLQTRLGVLMTTNLYLPKGKEERRPAVLCVHGHWRQAKSEKVVQSRCIGLAKLGFVVLMVDAFGAGERGLGKALGEYHGEMVAGALWPTGLALAGLQVYENMRAVDYLLSRNDVDPQRLGVTGCSGGGNQTMYVGAMDDRLKCVVPVCSVGTYQAYLGAACCMCEVTPGALTYTEESGVLSLVAPRALMLINATQDGFQFSVGEAKKSLSAAQPVFDLYNKSSHTRHVVVESKHGYNQEMREAMYGWMCLHLKGQGDGSPLKEPSIETEAAETLRCFPGDSRPDDFLTLPQFAAREAAKILKRHAKPDHKEGWQASETLMRESLSRVLGGTPKGISTESILKTVTSADNTQGQQIDFAPEPGLTVSTFYQAVDGKGRKLALLLDLDRGRNASQGPLAEALLAEGWDLATADLRATGVNARANDKIGRAPDHNTAEWSMWIGRPLLGQWVWDVRRLLDVLHHAANGLPEQVAIVGVGTASMTALCAAALDRRIKQVATWGGLSSFITDSPFEKQRLGNMAPGFLRDIGDVAQLASLVSPRKLVLANPVDAAGNSLTEEQTTRAFEWTRSAYRMDGRGPRLQTLAKATPKQLAAMLSSKTPTKS